MRREERVTVQGPVKKQQPHGMSQRGGVVPDIHPSKILALFLSAKNAFFKHRPQWKELSTLYCVEMHAVALIFPR